MYVNNPYGFGKIKLKGYKTFYDRKEAEKVAKRLKDEGYVTRIEKITRGYMLYRD